MRVCEIVRKTFSRRERILAGEKKRNATTRLRSQRAVVDSRRLQPPFRTPGMYALPQWGGAENFHSGGRAAWASLFWWSSG